jgi:hypothetical protein
MKEIILNRLSHDIMNIWHEFKIIDGRLVLSMIAETIKDGKLFMLTYSILKNRSCR